MLLLLSVDRKTQRFSLWDTPEARTRGAESHEIFINLELTGKQVDRLFTDEFNTFEVSCSIRLDETQNVDFTPHAPSKDTGPRRQGRLADWSDIILRRNRG